MTTKDAILLAVKQDENALYPALLNKIASDYSNTNSARAALSRALRDLAAVGLIRRSGNRIMLTQRGMQKVSTDMKNKLLLKLNAMIRAGREDTDMGAVVELLSILLEHSKKDKDLKKIAQRGLAFEIADLEVMRTRFSGRIQHDRYLEGVLGKQLKTLRALNFRDRFEGAWSKPIKKALLEKQKKSRKKIYYVDTPDKAFLEKAAARIKGTAKQEHTYFPQDSLSDFFKLLERHPAARQGMELFIDDMQVRLSGGHVVVLGPYEKLQRLEGNDKKG